MSNKTTLIAAAELANVITRIGKTGASLKLAIQEAAVQCIGQSIVHRNITPAQQLYDNLGSGQRRDALVKYFELFGNIAWADKKIAFYDVEKMTKDTATPRVLAWTDDYVDLVSAMSWDAAKKENPIVSEFDVSDEVTKFIDRMFKAVTKGSTVKNTALLAQLQQTVAAYNFKAYVAENKDALKAELTDEPQS